MTPFDARQRSHNIPLWLKQHGWNAATRGVAGTMWSKADARVGVPDDLGPSPEDWIGIFARIAAVEGRESIDVARAVDNLFIDVHSVRAANDIVIVETIPLEAGMTMVQSARALLRTAATTARRERGQIGGNYAPLGDDVVKRARMGHTEAGSYVVPILVNLPDNSDLVQLQDQLDDMTSMSRQMEPFERRVTRTMAQSLQSVRKVIIDPAHEPRGQQMHELVQQGVSREFCQALIKVLKEPAVAEFETRYQWAGAYTAPGGLDASTAIPSAAAPLLEKTADLLREVRVDRQQIFSGPIVELRHEPDDPFGEISVSTFRNGRECEIRVQLPYALYERAVGWHHDRKAVLVEGQVRRAFGSRLRVDTAARVLPLEETMMQATQ